MTTRKRFGLASIALISICVAVPVTAAQTDRDACIALVQVGNNLWRAQINGKPISQVTNDTLPRYAAALNPRGNLIAFSGKQTPDDITLLDESGRTVLNFSVNSQDAIIQLKWLSPTILKAEEHYSPNGSKFHFIDFSAGYSFPVISPTLAAGTQCAPSPDGKDMACQIAASELNLNGRTLYRVVDEFTSAPSLQSLSMAAGTSVLTSTSPKFGIDFKSVSRTGRINLRVTTPDGLWSEQSISLGGRLVLKYEDSSHPLADYGFEPVLSGTGVIRLVLKKSLKGETRFEGDVAWDPRGKRIAVVTANQAGDRTLIVLNRQMGSAADTGEGGIDLQQPLALAGPVRSISFTSNSHIRVVGATQQFDLDIPAQGKITNGGAFSVSEALPSTLNVNFATGVTPTEVKDWYCP